MTDLGPKDGVSLRLTSDARNLRVVRALVRAYAEDVAGFDERRAGQITLAADEGCANVIRHCYGGRSDGLMELALSLEDHPEAGRRLVIRLRDYGPRVERETLGPPAQPRPTTPGGLGLLLIHEIMDSVELVHEGDVGNVLVLSAACPTAEGADS